MELDEAAGGLDLALVGVVEAGEDVHQGRLAGAVLAEERVDLPGATSNVTPSFATMPGNRFVIPRMATAVLSGRPWVPLLARASMERDPKACVLPSPSGSRRRP